MYNLYDTENNNIVIQNNTEEMNPNIQYVQINENAKLLKTKW